MNAAEWIAFGGLVMVVLGAIVTGVIHAVKTAYTFGQHAQRMDQAETDIGKLQAKQDEHARSISSWDQALRLLEEVRGDVKMLMTGKSAPARRRAGEG